MTSPHEPTEDIIITLGPTLARFWFAIITIGSCGGLLLFAAARGNAGSLFAMIVLIVVSGFAFLAAHSIYKTRDKSISLTQEGLFDETGHRLCSIQKIASVDRSFSAFKPSNGFVLRLKEPMDRAWVPGLWWRYGKSLGVGGITSPSHAKAMANAIELLLDDSPKALDA